ncbi:MAG: 6-carboxytetrahydropterin synthase, partial [Bryobacteraceae bacterium]
GHNYTLDVSVRGALDAAGRVADVRELDRLVGEQVLAALDHRNLNAEVAAFASVVPTTENIAVHVKTLLERSWKDAFPAPGPVLDRIRIEETDNNFFELPSL